MSPGCSTSCACSPVPASTRAPLDRRARRRRPARSRAPEPSSSRSTAASASGSASSPPTDELARLPAPPDGDGRQPRADDRGAHRHACRARARQLPHSHPAWRASCSSPPPTRARRLDEKLFLELFAHERPAPAVRRHDTDADERRPAASHHPCGRARESTEDQPLARRGLWAERAFGIVGGEPKCCKSFLALDLAVAVASGTPACGRFAVPTPGPVLLFAAEDALSHVRERLDGSPAPVVPLSTPRPPRDHRPQRPPRSRSRSAATAAHRRAACPASRARSLRPPAPHRRERGQRGRPAARLPARPRAQAPTSVLLVHHARKAAGTPAPARPCAAPPSSTPGATPTSTCAAGTRPLILDRRAPRRPGIPDLLLRNRPPLPIDRARDRYPPRCATTPSPTTQPRAASRATSRRASPFATPPSALSHSHQHPVPDARKR